MNRAPALLLLLAGLALAGGGKPAKVKLAPDEKALLDLLNKERKKEKLPELTLNATLCKAARRHSENMAKQEKMSHQLDGKSVGDRVTETGYDWLSIGENLAKSEAEGPGDPPASPPEEIHKMWMDSKGHRENILNPKYREVGIAKARSSKGTYYYTQVFASRRR
jgi:uncharacterized protein YkwD